MVAAPRQDRCRSRGYVRQPSLSVLIIVLITITILNVHHMEKKEFQDRMEFSLLDRGFHLYHHIRGDRVHIMGGFCVFRNLDHQLSFGWSRGLKPTALTNTYKGWHLFSPVRNRLVAIYLLLLLAG